MDARVRSWLPLVAVLVCSRLIACQDPQSPDDLEGSVSGRSLTEVEQPQNCDNNPCGNNGTCRTETYEDGTIAVCTCQDGFAGAYCDQPDPRTHPCVPSPCYNGGTCKVDRSRTAGFVCYCAAGYSGDTCIQRSGGGGSVVSPGCSACQAGEICQMVGNQALCLPGPSSGHPCVPSPCRNSGTCEVYQDSQGTRSYRCQCQAGYSGVNCEFGGGGFTCNSGTCLHGTCASPTYCKCYSGWQGANCNTQVRSGSCLQNPCFNGGRCQTNGYGPSTCVCVYPYSGPRCELRSGGTNPCQPRSPCQNGAICNPNGSPICRCVGRFTGTYCETALPNPCYPNPCLNGAECTINGQSFTCACKTGTTGPRCGSRSVDPCNPSPCRHGICYPSGSTFRCQCYTGYSGTYCDQTVNPCSSHPCANGGTCSPIGQHYSCRCALGYSGQRCRIRATGCQPNPCQNGGVCYSHLGGVACHCPSGFRGSFCEVKTDPCAGVLCLHGGICDPSSGNCRCAAGWFGPLCQYRKDPCASSPCYNGGICAASLIGAGYTCTCSGGYSGPRCGIPPPPPNPCSPNPCLHGGHCSSHYGIGAGYTCTCSGGYSGPRCGIPPPPPNPCSPNPCLHGGHCTSHNRIGAGYTCTCSGGYSGPRCGIPPPPPNPCSPNPCLNGGHCTRHNTFHTCTCINGYSGDVCQTPPDPCVPNPCHNGGHCNSYAGTAQCTCVNGYRGQFCRFPPPPSPEPSRCNPNPCRNGGSCRPRFRKFICTCPAGWIGRICQTPSGRNLACEPNPCLNGCQCHPSCRHANGYYCRGTNGLLGRNCQLPAPVVTCGPNSITVTIDSSVVDEYDPGIGGFLMFMAQSSSMTPSPTCPAQKAGSTYSVALPLPFSGCGSSVVTRSDGKTVVSNYIWLNRLIANGVADMPVPILHFSCSYEKQYNVITSLKPAVGVAPTVLSRGARTDAANIELCKSGKFCPSQCPAAFFLTQGATYTVGEELNLRISLTNMANQFRVLDLFLSCKSDPTVTTATAPIVLLANGCLAISSGKYLPTKIKPTTTGTCASFPVPLMKGCADFFIHAKLQPCSSRTCLAAYGPCMVPGRRKRSEETIEIESAKELETDETSTVKVFGPIVVIKGKEGIVVAKVLYPGEEYLNSTETGVLVLKEEQTPDTTETPTMLPLQIALGVLLVLALSLFSLLVFFNWRYINAHCGRKV